MYHHSSARLDDICYKQESDLIAEIADDVRQLQVLKQKSSQQVYQYTQCTLQSVRLPEQHIATVPYKVIEQMTHHPLTDQGIAKFQADYKAVFGE